MIVLACIASILGFALGFIVARMTSSGRIQKAYEQAKHEFESEKKDLSTDLSAELERIRDSIAQSVMAYDNTVEILEERLSLSDESRKRLDLTERQIDYYEELSQTPASDRPAPPMTDEISDQNISDSDINDEVRTSGAIDPEPSTNIKEGNTEDAHQSDCA